MSDKHEPLVKGQKPQSGIFKYGEKPHGWGNIQGGVPPKPQPTTGQQDKKPPNRG